MANGDPTQTAGLLAALSLATVASAIVKAGSAGASARATAGPGETVIGWGSNSDGQLVVRARLGAAGAEAAG